MWSPQHDITNGRAQGIDQQVLDNAVDQIGRVLDGKYELPSLLTLNHLAKRANVDYKILRAIVERAGDSPYRHFAIQNAPAV